MTLVQRLNLNHCLTGLYGGLFVAVQTLFLLEKGIDTWLIGVLFGTYGAAAAVFELPLGALADLHGRVRLFRVSQVVGVAGIILAISSDHFAVLLAAMIILGLQRALASGTVDAWQVEQLTTAGHGERLTQLMGQFQSFAAIGLAAGALLGGYLPGWLGEHAGILLPTEVNLAVMALAMALHLLITPWLFHEGDPLPQGEANGSIEGQLRTAFEHGWREPALRSLMLTALAFGVVLACIETYWQPQVRSIAPDAAYSVFGWLAAGYFVAAALGPILFGLIAARTRLSSESQVSVLLLLVAPPLFLLARQTGLPGFAACYLGFMWVFTMMNVPIEVLLARHTENSVRSTVYSTFSLIMQAGAAVSAYLLSPLVKVWGIVGVWQLLAAGLMLLAASRFIAGYRKPAVTAMTDKSTC